MSETASAAEIAPEALGVNNTVIVQLLPAANELPHVLASVKSLALVPVKAMPVMVKAALPVLVRVTTSGELVMVAGSSPNAKLEGERLAVEPEAELMVTVSVAVPVPPLLVALTVTVDVPAAVGVPEISPLVALTVRPAGNPDAP